MNDDVRRALETLARAAGGDPGPEVSARALWSEWSPWAELHRRDWRKCAAHRRGLLDTRITLDDGITCLGDLPWHRCDVRAADAWRTAMMKARNKHGRPFAASTRNSMLTTLRSMLRWHVQRRRIPRHPLSGAANEPEREREGYFTDDQAETFARALPHPYSLIFRLSYRCGGLRNREVRELPKLHVDVAARTIVIPGARHKNGKGKVIPVTDDLWPELERQMRGPGPFVFPRARDATKPISPSAWQWQWDHARARVGITLLGERPVLHHARHTFAIESLGKGASTAALMSVMGHVSERAARRYQRLVGPALDHMREIMNRKPARRSEPQVKKNLDRETRSRVR